MRNLRSAAILLLALFSASIRSSAQQATPGNSELAPKSSFLVIYKPGPAWLPGKPLKEQPLQEHGRYILSLYAKGILKLGGPFSDDTGGAAVLEAADESDAQAIVAKDPAVISKIFNTEVHPWTLVQWERFAKK